MKGACPRPTELLAFLEDALQGEEARNIEEHIAACDECRARAQSVTRTTSVLRNIGGAMRGRLGGCPDSELLAAYADRSLTGVAAGRVEEHLAGCGACLSEVCDLWELAGDAGRDARDVAVARALRRLGADGRKAVVRLAGSALSLVSDFAHRASSVVGGGLASSGTAALAPTRGPSDRVLLTWSGPDGLDLTCRLDARAGDVSLTGSLTRAGAPATDISVSLVSGGTQRGPESIDARGRFGPWAVRADRGTIVLGGRALGDDTVKLDISLVA